MWAPDSPDGPGALHSCIEGLPGGGFCPWLRMQAAWGVQSETCCGEEFRHEEKISNTPIIKKSH